jgi:hypothetical protein
MILDGKRANLKNVTQAEIPETLRGNSSSVVAQRLPICVLRRDEALGGIKGSRGKIPASEP